MRFKLDENLPPSASEWLRGLGHDVRTVYDQGLQAYDDPAILRACQDEGRALVSLDLDFSNILVFGSPARRWLGFPGIAYGSLANGTGTGRASSWNLSMEAVWAMAFMDAAVRMLVRRS